MASKKATGNGFCLTGNVLNPKIPTEALSKSKTAKQHVIIYSSSQKKEKQRKYINNIINTLLWLKTPSFQLFNVALPKKACLETVRASCLDALAAHPKLSIASRRPGVTERPKRSTVLQREGYPKGSAKLVKSQKKESFNMFQ